MVLVEYDNGTVGSISIGAVIMGSGLHRKITAKRHCTVFALAFWPHGQEEATMVYLPPERLRPNDTYTITEIEVKGWAGS